MWKWLGDIILVRPSATGTFRHWSDTWKELEADRVDITMYYRKQNGEPILGPTSLMFNDPQFLAVGRGYPNVAPYQICESSYQMMLCQVS